MTLQLSKGIKVALVVCIVVTLLPVTGLLGFELQNRSVAGRDAGAMESYNLPPAEFISAMAFGYNELAADLVWIRAINYFTDQLYDHKELVHIERYLNTIVAFNYRFPTVYEFGPAMMLSSNDSDHTDEEVMAAIRLLKRATEAFPQDWRFAKSLGSYYLFELDGKDAAEKRRNKLTGATWMRRAALLGSKLPWLASLAAQVLQEEGQRELAIKHLQEVYLATQDERMKFQIMMRLKSLKAESLANSLKTEAERFAEQRKSSGLDFLPPDLYIQLNQEPLGPFSLR